MHVIAQAAVQQAEGAKIILVFVAIVIVAFWRIALRLILAIIAVAIIVAVGFGALAIAHM